MCLLPIAEFQTLVLRAYIIYFYKNLDKNMLVPNMVMKFHKFDIFTKCITFVTCRLHSPAAWKA